MKCGSRRSMDFVPDAARLRAREALCQIGWPGGKLRQTEFSAAFAGEAETAFQPNELQKTVAKASNAPICFIPSMETKKPKEASFLGFMSSLNLKDGGGVSRRFPHLTRTKSRYSPSILERSLI